MKKVTFSRQKASALTPVKKAASSASAASAGSAVFRKHSLAPIMQLGDSGVTHSLSSHSSPHDQPSTSRVTCCRAQSPPSFRITSDFLTASAPLTTPLFIVILNYNLSPSVTDIWHKASCRICADGGANRLYDSLPSFLPGKAEQVRRSFWPDAIVGDLDSIRADVREYYKAGGSQVLDLAHDQASTDTCKCLKYLEEHVIPAGSDHNIVIYGALGGRLDHTLANLSALHRFQHLKITLMGDGSLARLLRPGRTIISPHATLEGPQCGFAPLSATAIVSTSGLRWDVDKAELSMGGLISTSNCLIGGEVMVETDNPLVWTTEVKEGREAGRDGWEGVIVSKEHGGLQSHTPHRSRV